MNVSLRSFTQLLIFLSLVFALMFGANPLVYAQGLALKVQPSTIDERLDPGQSLEGSLTVTNENGGKQTYYISTRNVEGMEDSGTPMFSDEFSDDPLEAASWVRPSLKEVTLEVGESKEIPYVITVPQNASPGSYFAAFFVTREADVATESGAGVGFHVASLVNLRVNGDAVEDMLFREFSSAKSFFTSPSVFFSMRVENTGTVHLRPHGIITVYDMLGNEVSKVIFNDSKGAVLPKYDRVFDATWNYGGFALGRYTASASISYGDMKKQTATKEVSFWVVPLQEVGIVFGGIVLLLLTFVFGVRRYIRNAIKKAGHGSITVTQSSSISFAQRLVKTSVRIIIVLGILFVGMIVFFA
jgi:hypothetical protein